MFHDCAVVRPPPLRQYHETRTDMPPQTRNYIIIMRMPYMVDLTDIEKPGNHQW